MSRKTKPEDISKAIGGQLRNWSTEFHKDFKKLAEGKGKELAKTLRKTSPKRTGKYARSWTTKVLSNNTFEYYVSVRNRDHYQLTHLLEKPHQKRNGGRTTPKVHIKPARDKIEQEFINETKDLIENTK